MAIGYDNRAVTKQSFAFNTAAPAQSTTQATGVSRGVQIIGGESKGGVVSATPQTEAGDITSGLGEYFGKLMEPYVARKQQEKFFEGFTAAQSGIALDEPSHPDSAQSRVFGPSGFEKGAQFYTAQAAVSTWQAAQMADMDTLKRMAPKELAAHVAKTSAGALTGDRFADQFVQRGLLDAAGPLLNSVSKERYAWQQQEAIDTQHVALVSGGAALQRIIVTQTSTGNNDPDAAGQAAISQSMATFTGQLAQPHGMDDDSYQKMLMGVARDSMQSGNGYAFEAMRRSPAWARVTTDNQDKLDEQYEKFGKRANAEATHTYTTQLIEHDAKVAAGTLTAIDAAADLAAINTKIKRSTGFDIDVFDASDVRGEAHTVTSAVIAAANKADERRYQLQLRNEDRAYDRAEKDRVEHLEASTAKVAWSAGNPVEAIAGGVKKDLIEAQANNDWVNGNLVNIVRTFNGGYVSDAVKASAKSSVEAATGEQYSKDFKRVHEKWQQLYAAKPAAAMQYYGTYHPIMQRFDQLVRQGSDPITAYSKTFGDPAHYGTSDMTPDRRKAVDKAMDKVVSSQRGWFGSWLGGDLGANGENVVRAVARNHVAAAGNNSATPTEKLMEEAIEAATADGSFERFGQFAWTNRSGTEPLRHMLGLRERDATAVFSAVYNKHMKAIGAANDTDPDSLIRYDNNGHPALIAVVRNKRGEQTRVAITYEELAATTANFVAGRVTAPPLPRAVRVAAEEEARLRRVKDTPDPFTMRGRRVIADSISDALAPLGAPGRAADAAFAARQKAMKPRPRKR